MLDSIERKIRLRTEQLCKERGHAKGRALEEWLRALSEVLTTSAWKQSRMSVAVRKKLSLLRKKRWAEAKMRPKAQRSV